MAPPAQTPLLGMRVLLAEDNPINALLARTLLTRAGCIVTGAHNGEEAVAVAATGAFDLILLDIRMPRLDGFAAAELIRAGGGPSAAAPIVALTADAGAALSPTPAGTVEMDTAGDFLVYRTDDGEVYAATLSGGGTAHALDPYADDPALAFALSRLTDSEYLRQTPIGIFRSVERPVFDDEARAQVSTPDDRVAALQRIVTGGDTWQVG